MRTATITVAVLFTLAGLFVACTDLRDHITVQPTPAPGSVGPPASTTPSAEPLTINEAKREVETVAADTARWIEWRKIDIAKREQLVAFIEGVAAGGLPALLGEVGQYVGPFAPLLTLLGGYAIKRRNDVTADDYREGKQDSFNKGLEVGKKLAQAAGAKGKTEEQA